ncbi:MAG: hypothetical protein RML48_04855 [Candidatus Bipolaricaulota bacterium]|nr:hypothetical protein [Candidatus Bipolaricaulota bacterium]
MELNALLQRLDKTGTRLSDLEGKVELVRSRLQRWQVAALVGIGAAVVLGLLWLSERQRRERCERERAL